MKWTTLPVALLCVLTACNKTPVTTPVLPAPKPEVNVISFNNREIKFNQSFAADLDHNGSNDFYVSTLHVGDAMLQRDYKRFFFGTSQSTDFPINASEEIPVLDKNAIIGSNTFYGYNWYSIASILAAQKVTTSDREWWEGPWKDLFNKHLPLRIHSSGKLYYGWVEVSFDSGNEKLILHKAVISKQADVAVKIE